MPATATCASVLFRETVRISLSVVALIAFKVMAPNILNAYITVPNEEKTWKSLDPKFRKDKDQKAIVVRTLYGLKFFWSSISDSPG